MQYISKSLLAVGFLAISIPAHSFIQHVEITKSSGLGWWKDVEKTSQLDINLGITKFSIQLKKDAQSLEGMDYTKSVSNNLTLETIGVIGFAALMTYAIINSKAETIAEQEVAQDVENS